MITLYYLREVWIGECEDYIPKYQSAVSWVLSFFFLITFCSMFLIFPVCFHLLKCNAASQNRFRWMMNDDVVVSFKRLWIQPSTARDTANLSLCDYKSPNCNPLFSLKTKLLKFVQPEKANPYLYIIYPCLFSVAPPPSPPSFLTRPLPFRSVYPNIFVRSETVVNSILSSRPSLSTSTRPARTSGWQPGPLL